MHFERLTGRKRKALADRYDEPVIIKLRNGKTYGGAIDECYYNGGEIVALYSTKLLDETSHRWVDHDIMMQFNGKLVRDGLPDFWIADIREVFVLRNSETTSTWRMRYNYGLTLTTNHFLEWSVTEAMKRSILRNVMLGFMRHSLSYSWKHNCTTVHYLLKQEMKIGTGESKNHLSASDDGS